MIDNTVPPSSPAPDTPPPARAPDVAISIIRTWVPIAVGAVLAWLAEARHAVIPAHASAAVGTVAAALLAGWYYTLARALEGTRNKTTRAVGRYMLGGVVPPVYLDAAEQARILR